MSWAMDDTNTPQIPDAVRARVRTAAQAFGGFLVALLAKFLADRVGLELPGWVADELAVALAGLVVAASTVVWMVAVRALSRVWAGFERLEILKGTPVYRPPS